MKRLLLALLCLISPAFAAETYTVQSVSLTDPKAVFATVESVDVAAARARIGGTLANLAVDEGASVERGQVIAVVGDEKLALQVSALDAQIAALTAQNAKAQQDLVRAQDLFRSGTIAKAKMDEIKSLADVAGNQLKARKADRSVVDQQMADGQVLAPAPGRVLQVPVTRGSVVMPGETIAMIAADAYILRLRLPERHAQALKVGDEIRTEHGAVGYIRQVYPLIETGRVTADADVPNLKDYFVGQRVRVWVNTDQRVGFVVPSAYLFTKGGVDYVRVGTLDVPVQRGQTRDADGVEILSGVHAGDVLSLPIKE